MKKLIFFHRLWGKPVVFFNKKGKQVEILTFLRLIPSENQAKLGDYYGVEKIEEF